MANRSSGVLEFAAGLFLGGLAGAALGLLLAPQPGEETRRRIAERGIELHHELEKRATDLQDKVPTFVDEQRARVEEAIEKGKEAAAKKRQEILGQLEAEKGTGETA
jgi:gas vesicle protein